MNFRTVGQQGTTTLKHAEEVVARFMGKLREREEGMEGALVVGPEGDGHAVTVNGVRLHFRAARLLDGTAVVEVCYCVRDAYGQTATRVCKRHAVDRFGAVDRRDRGQVVSEVLSTIDEGYKKIRERHGGDARVLDGMILEGESDEDGASGRE